MLKIEIFIKKTMWRIIKTTENNKGFKIFVKLK